MLYLMRSGLLTTVMVLMAMTAAGQRRYDCMANLEPGCATRGVLGYPSQQWDASRTYRQAVVLISFTDCDFSMADPAAYYDRILNRRGYNEGAGPGSMADYFRDQSDGLFNLRFDVFGPVRVGISVKTGTSGVSYGTAAVSSALKLLLQRTAADFSPYDWDGDGRIDQVICIVAGYTGSMVDGYIWPNTGSVSVAISKELRFSTYSLSCERWPDGALCGIGTICHEFSHCLGLPDLYPLTTDESAPFSVVDEWDLMDGGNYTGRGWCPPNYSAMERMLLGWHQPRELTGPASVRGMLPVAGGGESFLIRNAANADEYYLLENRQRTGWDYGLPGEGLLVAHVDYHRETWSSNRVNSQKGHLRYDLVHADNRDYRSWDPADDGRDPNKYTMTGNLRNRYLSTSAYPWQSPATGHTNRELTDTSVPAAVVFARQTDGRSLLSKPLTNIYLDQDRSVSFDFMGDATAIQGALPTLSGGCPDDSVTSDYYDLSGRRLTAPPHSGTPYITTAPGSSPRVKVNRR